ncbi:uncharacterized protein LOC128857024 isoform X2 [Anastrepha ludens]|nr:uncharacterized protein LOC128857024 isoform X2 [Anastrepha ludens]
MCLARTRSRTQKQQSNGKVTSAATVISSKEQCKCVQLNTRIPAAESLPTNAASDSSVNVYAAKECRSTCAGPYTCLIFENFLLFTVTTMLLFVFVLPVYGLVAAAPTPWSNTCGMYASADEQLSYEPLHGVERERVLCELRGNLTKQIKSLRSFMGPQNFSKVWVKHNKSYAFLKVPRGKNVTLRTWHKQLQVYVAAADQLYERAYNYKTLQQNTWISSHEQTNRIDEALKRLRHLILTTRSILCDLEVTANLLAKRHLPSKAFTIDTAAMQAYIRLRSDKRSAGEGVDPIDINMLYQRLRRSLLHMRQTLKSRCGKGRPGVKRRGEKKKQDEKAVQQGGQQQEQEQEVIRKTKKKARKQQADKSTSINPQRQTHKLRHQEKRTLSPLGQS